MAAIAAFKEAYMINTNNRTILGTEQCLYTFQSLLFTCILPVKLIDYGADYYLLFWRSTDYRTAFKQQLKSLLTCKKYKYNEVTTVKTVSIITITKTTRTRSLHT